MPEPKKFRLIEDNDGHWFVIPAAKEDQFYKWVKAQEEGKSYRGDASQFIEVNGPHNVLFTDWESP